MDNLDTGFVDLLRGYGNRRCSEIRRQGTEISCLAKFRKDFGNAWPRAWVACCQARPYYLKRRWPR